MAVQTPPTYSRLLAGLRQFRHKVYPELRDVYRKAVSEPQRPHALVIGCSDSRVDPELLTQSGPGEIFVTRNIGNLVPPYGQMPSAVSAVIEYAVEVLRVDEIVMCGHTDCGAMKSLAQIETLSQHPATRSWLTNADAALAIVRARNDETESPAALQQLIEENVLLQIAHLKTHPTIAGRLARGEISLHGWVYDIGRGDVLVYDPLQERFVPLDEIPESE